MGWISNVRKSDKKVYVDIGVAGEGWSVALIGTGGAEDSASGAGSTSNVLLDATTYGIHVIELTCNWSTPNPCDDVETDVLNPCSTDQAGFGHMSNDVASTRLYWARFNKCTAYISGTVSDINVKSQTAGNVKLAIYSDNGGLPGTVLWQCGSTAISTGWNSINISPTFGITKDTAYWIGCIADVDYSIYYSSHNGYSSLVSRYQESQTYATYTFVDSPSTSPSTTPQPLSAYVDVTGATPVNKYFYLPRFS